MKKKFKKFINESNEMPYKRKKRENSDTSEGDNAIDGTEVVGDVVSYDKQLKLTEMVINASIDDLTKVIELVIHDNKKAFSMKK